MQEPVYVLHLITCHGHIMPRLAELLFHLGQFLSNYWSYRGILVLVKCLCLP